MKPAVQPTIGSTLLRHATCSATLAGLIGVVDGGMAAARASHSVPTGAALGGATLILVGAGVGVLQGLLVWFPGRSVCEAVERRKRAAGLAGAADRLSFAIAAAVMLCGYVVATTPLQRVKEASLRNLLELAAVAAALLLQGFVAAALFPWVRRSIEAFQRRWGWPFPPQPTLRAALYGFVPSALATVFLFYVYGAKLGILTWLLFALSFASAQWAFLRWRRPSEGGMRGRQWGGAFVFMIVAAALATQSLFLTFPGASEVSQRAKVLPFALGLLRRVSDFDSDGHSSLFGGRDCAAFDPARSPGQAEIARNGVDEDCSGTDQLEEAHAESFARSSSKWTPDNQRTFNILWFVVDSLRADHLSAYGYAADTTPYLRELSGEAWLFEQAYSQSSTTPLSVPSMLTGRWPGRMQWKPGTFPSPGDTEVMLPQLLSSKGYKTTLVQNSWVAAKLPTLAHGFASVRTAPTEVEWKSGAYALSNTVLAIEAARESSAPFFVVVHLDDVHHPYVGHRGYALRGSGAALEAIQDYDRGASLADLLVRLTATHLKNTGIWDETVLVVTADHGEEFGEHGGSIHSATCYKEVTHVPLIARVPGTQPLRIESRVALVDLVPTMLELIGENASALDLDGQSLLVPALEPNEAPAARAIYCSIYQLFQGRKPFFIRSIRDGAHALIHDALSDRIELFDTLVDAGEQQDLSKQPEMSATFRALRARLEQAPRGNLFSVSEH